MRKTWQVGDQIERRWEIYKILHGGAGIVYIVYDHAFREPFAAKTFQDEVFAYSPAKPFLFLEYVSGGDLGSWIGTPRLTEDLGQVLRFAIQFCDGMIHAMSKGITAHRDIKPRNCLITHDGMLKVTDFGLAKLFDEEKLPDAIGVGNAPYSYNLTATAIGTCTHMAPEQFSSARWVDVRADIYAFGVMLYQMVKG
jgi:serine/threonine protein kinase